MHSLLLTLDNYQQQTSHTFVNGNENYKLVAIGCVAQLAERRSLAGELTLSYARPVANG